MIHVDTSFLVDLLKEERRSVRGGATELLGSLLEGPLGMSIAVLCELEAGIRLAGDPVRERRRVEAAIRPLELVPIDPRIAALYGELCATLQKRGEALAAIDLLIAATALAHAAPIVSRNRRHFERVPGLELITY